MTEPVGRSETVRSSRPRPAHRPARGTGADLRRARHRQGDLRALRACAVTAPPAGRSSIRRRRLDRARTRRWSCSAPGRRSACSTASSNRRAAARCSSTRLADMAPRPRPSSPARSDSSFLRLGGREPGAPERARDRRDASRPRIRGRWPGCFREDLLPPGTCCRSGCRLLLSTAGRARPAAFYGQSFVDAENCRCCAASRWRRATVRATSFWPGNIAGELKNSCSVCWCAAARGDHASKRSELVIPMPRPTCRLRQDSYWRCRCAGAREQFERAHLQQQFCEWHVARQPRKVGVERTNLYRSCAPSASNLKRTRRMSRARLRPAPVIEDSVRTS